MGGLRRIVTWVVRVLLLVLLTVLALMNSDSVHLSVFGQYWEVPLPVLLLASVTFGMLIALLGVLGPYVGLRRQISALKREVAVHEAEQHRVPRAAAGVAADFEADPGRSMER